MDTVKNQTLAMCCSENIYFHIKPEKAALVLKVVHNFYLDSQIKSFQDTKSRSFM